MNPLARFPDVGVSARYQKTPFSAKIGSAAAAILVHNGTTAVLPETLGAPPCLIPTVATS